MSLKRCFTFQPLSRNSTASQSSSSWFAGASPMMPKSSEVFTRPVPNSSCQNRFTVTRARSGFSEETSHWARPRRFVDAPAGILCNALNGAATTWSFF